MTDRIVIRMVVGFLGVIALVSLLIAGYLANNDRGVPDVFIATVSASIGAVSALLAKTGSEYPPEG